MIICKMLQFTTETEDIQKKSKYNENELITTECWDQSKQMRKLMVLRILGYGTIAWLKLVTCNAYVRRMFSSIMSCL